MLTFSSDAPSPITVFADRADVQSLHSDIEILDATSRSQLGPVSIIVCGDDDRHESQQFLRIDGTHTEYR
jgi:hypothetical protein